MPSNTRIPKAELTGIYGAIVKRMSRKLLGDVAEPAEVAWHNRKVLNFSFLIGRKAQKWDQCDENLKSFAHMAVASLVGCSFCLDLGYFMAHNEGLDETKAREVPRWRESGVFTPLERDVLEYAEAMTQTPPTVTDEHVGAAAPPARRGRAGRAHGVHRAREPDGPQQHRLRHRVPGLLGRLRAQATRRSLDRVTADPFVTHRSLLFTVAYEMLGSAADAEDVVQETWLRWDGVDRAEVREPRAYLVRIVTRQALNRLRTLSRRREDYVGEWLPEPLLTSPDIAEDVEFAESVSIAMLTVLETLTPVERAVFVLHEVFDLPYPDIAASVDKTQAAVRQIAHRAREHVAARRPRIRVDRAEQQRVVDRFLTALQTGDLQVLLDVLAPDVVLIADGGGEVAAAREPVLGRERVASFLSRLKAVDPSAVVRAAWFNGAPAGRVERAGALDTAVSVVVADGRITRIYAIRNPHKLTGLGEEAALSR